MHFDELTPTELREELNRRQAETLARVRALVTEHVAVIERLELLAAAEPHGPTRSALLAAAQERRGQLGPDRRWLEDLEARARA